AWVGRAMAGSYDPDAMKRLAQLLAIRPGEGPLIALVATVFATVEAARGFGEIGADTLFLSRFGAGALPYLYVLLGFVSLAVPRGTSAAILGGFAGPLAAGPLARLAGTENLLLADAALLAVAASITARVAPRIAARPAAPTAERAPLTAELGAGYDYVRRSPL